MNESRWDVCTGQASEADVEPIIHPSGGGLLSYELMANSPLAAYAANPPPLEDILPWRVVPSGGHPCACMASPKAGIAPSQEDTQAPHPTFAQSAQRLIDLPRRPHTDVLYNRQTYLAHVGLMVDINIHRV